MLDQLRRALDDRERRLGAQHPDTLLAVRDLALLLQEQGKLAEAEPLFRRALEATSGSSARSTRARSPSSAT